MKKNYNAIDLVKFISAFLVIAVHTYPFMGINADLNYFFVQIVGRIAVPFFFIASSFLFFKKLDYSVGLKDRENINYLKHYIFRIFKLYLVWCLIYLVLVIFNWSREGFTLMSIVRLLRDFIFTGGYYHLWFLPAMIVSTLIIYFLLSKNNIKKVCIIAFVLYVIGMLINVYGAYIENIPVISNILRVYLEVFTTSRNGLFYAPIFTCIGLVVSENETRIKTNGLLIRTIICFVLFVGECLIIKSLQLNNDLTSMYIMLIPFSVYFFLLVLNTNLKDAKGYKTLRHLSTLLYVSHILFVVIIGLSPITSNMLLYIGVCLTSLVFSYIVYKLSKHISVLKELY